MSSAVSPGRPPGSVFARVMRFALVAGVLGWLTVIVVLLEPQPGAGSVEELARVCEEALNGGDAEALTAVLGPPLSGDAAAVAESLVDQAAEPNRGQWQVAVGNSAELVISDDLGPRAHVRVVEEDGRWLINPVVSLSSPLPEAPAS